MRLLCDVQVEVARLVVEMRLCMWTRYCNGVLFMDLELMYAAGIGVEVVLCGWYGADGLQRYCHLSLCIMAIKKLTTSHLQPRSDSHDRTRDNVHQRVSLATPANGLGVVGTPLSFVRL
jgi:hypothetical protein